MRNTFAPLFHLLMNEVTNIWLHFPPHHSAIVLSQYYMPNE